MNNSNQRHEINRQLIEIEITESMGEIEHHTIQAKGKEICEAGYRLALDDFGSRYSNLSFLSSVTFHVLKLDKGLINDIISNPKARDIVKSILSLCKDLHIEAIAEGVEYQEQVDILKELGCYHMQGYVYGKPIDAADFRPV